MTGALDTGKNYKLFALFFAIACLLLFASLISILSPTTFTLYFTLSSIFFLLSLAFLHGPLQYLQRLFRDEKLVFTVIYLSSIAFSLYATLIKGSFFLTLIACIIEVSSDTSKRPNSFSALLSPGLCSSLCQVGRVE